MVKCGHHVRLGTRSTDEFIKKLNVKYEEIQKVFLGKINQQIQNVPIKVMLGDTTIVDQTTFDPQRIEKFFSRIISELKEWNAQEISVTNNEDVRRIFTKFEIREGNYLLSGHMSIQFHVLLYYKSDHKVIECQKKLANLIDESKDREAEFAKMGDKFILNKLKEMGYEDPSHEKLFEVFFTNDSLREKIYKEFEEKSDSNFSEISKMKTELFNELDSYLLETYQTSPVLIDDNRLIGGEEGCLCTIDLEFIKNKTKEGLFDPRKMSEDTQGKLIRRIDQFLELLKTIEN